MKPLALNISKMKKISGDKNSSTFLHPSGHKMVIAHNGVSAAQRQQLVKMPVHNYADGGETISLNPDAPVPNNLVNPDPGSMSRSNAITANTTPDPDDLPYGTAPNPAEQVGPSPASVAPSAAEAQPQTDTKTSPTTVPQSNSDFDLNSAYNQGQKAISEQQGVASQLAKSDADIQSQSIADKQKLSDAFQTNTAGFADHQKQLMNDYMNNHINPNHYLENMSTPQKISTAIGLILGGAGAGAGRPNPALEFMNSQISRDISAQQSRSDQQKTLLGANQDLFKDQSIAQNQTRINMNDIYDHQIQLAASKMGTPQAKANADAAHSQFALQNAQLLQQNAIRKTVMDHLRNGGGGLSAIDLSHAGLIPEADAVKEQASIDAQNAGIKQVQDIYSKLGKEQTFGNRIANPIQSGSNIDAMNAQITNAVMGADVSKRLTPESAKLEVLPFHVNLKDNQQTVNNKMMGVMDLIKQHNAGMTPMMNRYSPQSLPNYPTQSANNSVKTMNGVPYQLGSDGNYHRVK